MPAGGPHDHPISDILHYKIEVYGHKTDEMFRELAIWLSDVEISEFWISKIGWQCEAEIAEVTIREKLDWARKRAKSVGWEQ